MDKQLYQAVCINGHQKTDKYESTTDPKEFCADCGKKLISTCQSCRTPIKGHLKLEGVYGSFRPTNIPNYCSTCSAPHPWTSFILEQSVELLALDTELSSSQKELIKNALPDLLVDTPATQVAIAKYKLNISNATKVVKDAMYNILIDTVSETAKKLLSN
ncbi:DUF2321 domain-containing protein [Brochothrix thermosphacta]|uniref:DUF2321 domain-containing protein n=1 Tax=Brochothrix thermosphacta TaxID=2756 RepID=UPI0039AEAAA3